MDNDIRIVDDKEVYLLASPSISKSETETAFHNWARATLAPRSRDAINIVGIEDLLLPMAIASVDSWGNWSLLQGNFQKREFERDQRQYERDYQAYQQEEKRQPAARQRGETYPLPPLPSTPDREAYFEYFPAQGEYAASFKAILRAFGEEALGRAKPYLNDLTAALDNLLRSRFPAAKAVAKAPVGINRAVLNTLIDEYVSDRGIDWLKEHARQYDAAKRLEISGIHYRRECNIIFLPVRVIEYSASGKFYTAIFDPIRNEYMIGVPPAMAPAVASQEPAPASARKNFGLIAGGAATAAVIIAAGAMFLAHSSKHEASTIVQAPSSDTHTTHVAVPQNQPPQAAQLAAAAAKQKAEQQVAQQLALAQAAKQAAATQAAQDAAVQAEQNAAAVQAAQAAAAAQTTRQIAAQQAVAAQAAQQATAHQVAAAQAGQPTIAARLAPPPVEKSLPNHSTNNPAAVANASPSVTVAISPAAPAAAPHHAASAKPNETATETTAPPAPATGQSAEEQATLARQAAGGNDLTYYTLGVAAQRAGHIDAARTYYQLSMQRSAINNPPSVCSPRHKASYQPNLCRGIVLPRSAQRALSLLFYGTQN